jgi:hypothetical protein
VFLGGEFIPALSLFVRMRNWIKYGTMDRLAVGLILLLLGEVIISWYVFAIMFYYKQ